VAQNFVNQLGFWEEIYYWCKAMVPTSFYENAREHLQFLRKRKTPATFQNPSFILNQHDRHTSHRYYDDSFPILEELTSEFCCENFVGPFSLFLGAVLMALCNVIFSYSSSKVSDGSKDLPILFWTTTIQTIALLPFQIKTKIKNVFAFATGAICLAAIMILGLIAFIFADPNEITAIISTCVFVTPVFSYFFFHIKFNHFVLPMMTCTCFIGIILLVQPPILFGSSSLTWKNLMGYGFASINMLSHAFLMCLQRVAEESETGMLFAAMLSLSIGLCIICIASDVAFLPIPHFGLFILSAVLNTISFFMFLQGWGKTDPQISSMIIQNQTLFTFIISWAFGMEKSGLITKGAGVCIIMTSVIVYLFYTRNEDQTIRYKSKLMRLFSSSGDVNSELSDKENYSDESKESEQEQRLV